MRVDSDDEMDHDYDMLDSDLDDEEMKNSAANDTPASTAPSSPPRPSYKKTRRCREKVHKCTFEDCDKVFDRKVRLEDHLRSHNNERNFECPYSPCTKTFLRDSHLKHHVKNQHTNVRDKNCTWEGCDASFATGTRLRRHIAAHEAKELYRCRGYSGCGQTFRKQETLDRHVLSAHSSIKPFPCKEVDPKTGVPCNKAYETAEHLRSHERAKHNNLRFSCEECRNLNIAILNNSEGQDDRPGIDANFATHAQLQAHNAEFHPPTCQYCPTSFITAKELARHLELQHDILPTKAAEESETAPVFTCTVPGCGKKFTKQGNLNVHTKTIHENNRDFVCGQTLIPLPSDINEFDREHLTVYGCGRNFTSKASLVEHVRTAHLGLYSRRMIRETQKRKAILPGDDTMFEEVYGTPKKQKKQRSDKNLIRGPALAGLTGLDEIAAQAVQEGRFPFGFGENEDNESRPFTPPPQRIVLSNLTLSASMTIVGDEIFSQGRAYHYPSGEYPTHKPPRISRRTVRRPTAQDDDLCTSPSRTFGSMRVDDHFEDVNFFGRFEQEHEDGEREREVANEAQSNSRATYWTYPEP